MTFTFILHDCGNLNHHFIKARKNLIFRNVYLVFSIHSLSYVCWFQVFHQSLVWVNRSNSGIDRFIPVYSSWLSWWDIWWFHLFLILITRGSSSCVQSLWSVLKCRGVGWIIFGSKWGGACITISGRWFWNNWRNMRVWCMSWVRCYSDWWFVWVSRWIGVADWSYLWWSRIVGIVEAVKM